MQNKQGYENFPIWIALLSCALSLSIYALGAYIFSQLGIFFTVLYLLFCLWIELRIFRESCVNCYYYGKTCGLGRGKLCALLFKKGNPEEFADKEISWIDILPDFTWLVLVLMVILAMLSLGGNALMRGSLVCKYCKQRELGCPAEQLFNKQTKTASSRSTFVGQPPH
jgi:hypothetical protein